VESKYVLFRTAVGCSFNVSKKISADLEKGCKNLGNKKIKVSKNYFLFPRLKGSPFNMVSAVQVIMTSNLCLDLNLSFGKI